MIREKIKKDFCVITEIGGRIIDILHLENNPFSVKFEKGKQIVEVLPVLTGIFPFCDNNLRLENIRFDNFTGNIILRNKHDQVLVCFSANNFDYNETAREVQRKNQDRLIAALEKKIPSPLKAESLFSDLGFMVFEKTRQGFILAGTIPEWFKELFPYYNYSSVVFDLQEIFPFLEVFIPDTQSLYNSGKSGYLSSGLWTQYTPEHKEIVLRALALKSNMSDYLLIESITERNPYKHDDLQKSRELYLKHKQLIKSEEAVKQLLKYREEFISIISHDIKSPISGAYALIDHLKSDEDFTSKIGEHHKHMFDMLQKNLKNVLEYAEQLYEWSHMNFRKIELNKQPLNLYNFLKDIESYYETKLKAKDLRIEYQMPRDLTIWVDDVFFKNAVQNILNNAVKFSYRGGVITFSAAETSHKVIFKIADRGTGMTNEVKKLLFSFSAKYSSEGTEGEKGTGIGMNIVKRIIDIHGAEIFVESKEGEGTVFVIEMPKEQAL